MLEIGPEAQVVRTHVLEIAIRFPLFEEFDCSVLIFDQPQVEKEETGDNKAEHASQHVRCHNKIGGGIVWVVFAQSLDHDFVGCEYYQVAENAGVEEHHHEVLVIVEPYTVGYPGTVMVHFEHAFVALGAVMAAVWLSAQASLAHPHTAVLFAFERFNPCNV